jgi:hypothetical protein
MPRPRHSNRHSHSAYAGAEYEATAQEFRISFIHGFLRPSYNDAFALSVGSGPGAIGACNICFRIVDKVSHLSYYTTNSELVNHYYWCTRHKGAADT